MFFDLFNACLKEFHQFFFCCLILGCLSVMWLEQLQIIKRNGIELHDMNGREDRKDEEELQSATMGFRPCMRANVTDNFYTHRKVSLHFDSKPHIHIDAQTLTRASDSIEFFCN